TSLRTLRARQPASTPSHVWVVLGQGRQRLALDDVEWFSAAGDYVEVHTGERSFLMNESLNQLEGMLPPARFLRIHRSTLINVNAVVRVTPSDGHLLLTTRAA